MISLQAPSTLSSPRRRRTGYHRCGGRNADVARDAPDRSNGSERSFAPLQEASRQQQLCHRSAVNAADADRLEESSSHRKRGPAPYKTKRRRAAGRG